MMYVHWKSLIFIGILFWLLLCVSDFLGETYWAKIWTKNVNDTIKKQYTGSFIDKSSVPKNSEALPNDYILIGIVRNLQAIVIFSLILFITKNIYWYFWKFYKNYKNQLVFTQFLKKKPTMDKQATSKIPVFQNRSNTTLSNCDINGIKSKLKLDSSCPNFFGANPNFEEIEQNAFGFGDTKFDRQHNDILSRQLDAIKKEKHELSKQLAMSFKENQAAKQQITELFAENSGLTKKLETVTKELKVSTKSRKGVLKKMEELTCNCEKLKVHLEQMTREKEWLQGKVKRIQEKYERLDNCECDDYALIGGKDDAKNNIEIDMKKFQMKISQLQENLNNFNPRKSDLIDGSKISLEEAISDQHGSKRFSNNASEISLYPTDNTESSSDERGGSRRIISGTVEFQNLLKNFNPTNRI